MWIARDSDKTLWIYLIKPEKDKKFGGWVIPDTCYVKDYSFLIPEDDLFPEVKWEDEEPRELILKPNKGRIDMIDVPYYECITSRDMSHKTNTNPMFVREIRIADVTKTEEHLLITTGNVICKIKLNDLKKIVKLIMEE